MTVLYYQGRDEYLHMLYTLRGIGVEFTVAEPTCSFVGHFICDKMSQEEIKEVMGVFEDE
jgi:hypothetical protein